MLSPVIPIMRCLIKAHMPRPVLASQGNAARLAAENLREKILFHGAQMLGEPVADVQLATPGVVRGKKGEVSFGDIAHKGETGTGFGSLVATGSYITPDFAFPVWRKLR